jgi:hypothetical protein
MKKEQKIQKHLARVPQHMALVPDAMRLQFQKQAGVIRDIFLYTIKKQFHTQNLFGQITFSAEEFCKEMGYNKNEMQRRLDIWTTKFPPPQLVDGHECDSMLEYSLYRAAKENVVFNRWSKEGNPMIVSYQILKSVEVIYDKSTNKTLKRVYSVVLSPQIFNEAFARYFVLDYNEYKLLAAKSSDATNSYRNFYVFLAGMIAISKYNNKYHFRTDVNKLAVVFDYEASEPRNLKTSIKRALDAIQSKLKFPFSYKFVPSEGSKSKVAYDVLFSFTDELFDDFDEKILGLFWKNIRGKTFKTYQNIKTKDIKEYREILRRKDEIKPDSEDFHNFWFSNERKELKKEIIDGLIKEMFPDTNFG